ncbi:MAG: hypothetical protein E7170_05065 [Firmicutes bacterium]|nr:hypothetical protein [Bacillota bacterium]
MLIYKKDEMIINIYNIRNLEYINIYDIVTPNSEKMKVIPALFISYDNGKTMNLCANDKYFDLFIKKVTEVYNDEKNNILEDNLTDPFKLRSVIKIDSHTKDILEQNILENRNQIYEFYNDKKSSDESLIFQKDEVDLLMPIIKYHIKELFKNTDKNIIFEEVNGYKNNYVLSGNINGIFKYFPLIINKYDNNYEIEIGNLLDNVSSLKMKINFLKDKIEVIVNMDYYKLEANYQYLITNNIIKEIQSVNVDNKLVNYINKDLEKTENNYKNITNFDQDNKLNWFLLPWGSMYGTNTNIKNISETEKVIEIYNMYLSVIEDSFIRKDFFSRTYKRNDTVTVFGKDIVLDEFIKNVIGIRLNENIFIIETSFLDTAHSNGYYKELLKNKYFNHFIEMKNIENISKEKLININENLSNTDVMNDEFILKLVRGK